MLKILPYDDDAWEAQTTVDLFPRLSVSHGVNIGYTEVHGGSAGTN